MTKITIQNRYLISSIETIKEDETLDEIMETVKLCLAGVGYSEGLIEKYFKE